MLTLNLLTLLSNPNHNIKGLNLFSTNKHTKPSGRCQTANCIQHCYWPSACARPNSLPDVYLFAVYTSGSRHGV